MLLQLLVELLLLKRHVMSLQVDTLKEPSGVKLWRASDLLTNKVIKYFIVFLFRRRGIAYATAPAESCDSTLATRFEDSYRWISWFLQAAFLYSRRLCAGSARRFFSQCLQNTVSNIKLPVDLPRRCTQPSSTLAYRFDAFLRWFLTT